MFEKRVLYLFPELLGHPPSSLRGQGFQEKSKNDAKDIFLHLGHRALETFKLLDAVKDLVEKLERLAILLLAQSLIHPSRWQLIKVLFLITVILVVRAESNDCCSSVSDQ